MKNLILKVIGILISTQEPYIQSLFIDPFASFNKSNDTFMSQILKIIFDKGVILQINSSIR
jgi:hypothetical protein